jgi:hypothetical protein
MRRGTGQTHWRANGSFHARSPGIVTTARMTPEDNKIPAPQHMQTYAVTYGRRMVGTISTAYDVDRVLGKSVRRGRSLAEEAVTHLEHSPWNTTH